MTTVQRKKSNLKTTTIILPVDIIAKLNLESARRKVLDPSKPATVKNAILDIVTEYFENQEKSDPMYDFSKINLEKK